MEKIISVIDLINDCFSYSIKGKNLKCICMIPNDLWNIAAIEGHVRQVIKNILVNADESMPDGGTINVTCENVVVTEKDALPLENGKYIKISFQDQGKGIPQEHLRNVLNPYFTTKETGRGLGLAIAYSIIKNHGGHIAVDSDLNSGATFTLFLPASSSQAVMYKEEEVSCASRGRILVMDDDKPWLNALGAILETLGFEAELANDGQQVVDKYFKALQAKDPFDAVIMDLVVPGGMGGTEAMKKLRDMDPSAKVIAAGGYCTDPTMSDYESLGFSGCIEKPYRVSELSRSIKKVIHS